MAIERKSANTKSTILQKAKNSNVKKTTTTTAAKSVKKTVRPNVRKKMTDEEKLASANTKSSLNVDPNSPLLTNEELKPKEEVLDPTFTTTEDGEDLKSINIGRKRKSKKAVENIDDDNAEKQEIEESQAQNEEIENTITADTEINESNNAKDSSTQELSDFTDNNDVINEEKEKKKFSLSNFTLSKEKLIALIVFYFVIAGAFFVFGLFTGRDLTPAGEAIPLETVSSTTNKAKLAENIEILKPEELQYSELKKVEAPEVDEEIAEGEDTINPAKGEIMPAPVAEAPAPPAIYDFSIRIVAYTSSEQADTLRAKLEGDGYRTQLITAPVGNKTWYYVHVNYRGTEDNMKQIQADISKKYRVSGTVVTKKEEV